MPTIGLDGEIPATRNNIEIGDNAGGKKEKRPCPDCEGEGFRITHGASVKNIIETCSACGGTGQQQ